MNWISGQVL